MKKILTLAIIGLAFQGYSQFTLNLQGCYPLDCDKAVNYAPPGAALNGMVSNVVCDVGHTGAPNTAYRFLGNTTSYISLPASPLLKPQAITVTGWYYIDQTTLNNGAYIVFTKNSCSTNQEAYCFCVTWGQFLIAKAGVTSPTCQRDILWGPNATVGWHFVSFYIDNSILEMYVDGCMAGQYWSMPTTITWDYVPGKRVILGGSQEAVDAPFSGKMDNLRFYDRRLSASEICVLWREDPRCQYGPKESLTSVLDVSKAGHIPGMDRNVPNPFNSNTLISYHIPTTFTQAQIVITTIEGKFVKAIDIKENGEGSINLPGEELGAGFYMYSLVVDGKTLETRKMLKE